MALQTIACLEKKVCIKKRFYPAWYPSLQWMTTLIAPPAPVLEVSKASRDCSSLK